VDGCGRRGEVEAAAVKGHHVRDLGDDESLDGGIAREHPLGAGKAAGLPEGCDVALEEEEFARGGAAHGGPFQVGRGADLLEGKAVGELEQLPLASKPAEISALPGRSRSRGLATRPTWILAWGRRACRLGI